MKGNRLWLLALLLVVAVSLSACSGAGNIASDEMDYLAKDEYSGEIIGETSTSDSVQDGRKIIENIDLTVQTKEFDTLLKNINKQITDLGGYVESSNISGREMDADNNRSADMTIRIPAEKSDTFTGFISENSVVVQQGVTTEDVTLQYVDMESRVAALEAEKESLENLLKNATTMTDIIAVRDKLTEVIQRIESYKSQLRVYDNLVAYCTVDLYIYEVERTAVVEKQGTWQQIGTNLKNNFADVWEVLVAIFVFFVSIIPYLIPLAVIAAVVLAILYARKKSRKKNPPQNNE